MIVAENCFCEVNNAPVRYVRGRVELYNGSTLLNTFRHTDLLKSFTIERVGEQDKFFGFGIIHKLNVKVLDKDRKLNITTANTLDVAFGIGCDFVYCYPLFRVSEVHRDENTNELSITAYDALYAANSKETAQLDLPQAYTIETFVNACAALLGVPVNIAADGFSTYFPDGANIDGTETIREALNAVAEATQTIYYLNNNYELTFKRLDVSGAAVAAITKDNYYTLDSKTNRRLTTIISATELGDNVSSTTGQSGTTQYIRDNPFWDLRQDIAELVDKAISNIGGLTVNQFDCKWRGNFLLEIGDKVAITNKDDSVVYSYVIDDTIVYDGSFNETTKWSYNNSETETAANPSSIGEAIKQTFARVDKVNKTIDLVASEVADNKENIASLRINTESIAANVVEVENAVSTNTDSISNINSTVSTHTENITTLQADTKSIKASVSNLETSTTTNKNNISGLTTTVNTHTSNITTLQADTNSIKANVSNLQTETTTNKDNISGLTTTVSTNTENITSLQAETGSLTASVSSLTETTTEHGNSINDNAAKITANTENISSIILNTESIAATVSSIETTTTDALGTLNDDITSLTNKVNATITANDVSIQIQEAINNGVDSITTETGYTFNNEGLTVAKSDSEMKTTISDDGMTVYKNEEAVLVANNVGVDAVNLRATTYLIVGSNSRFENYGSDRTGCFWIGE